MSPLSLRRQNEGLEGAFRATAGGLLRRSRAAGRSPVGSLRSWLDDQITGLLLVQEVVRCLIAFVTTLRGGVSVSVRRGAAASPSSFFLSLRGRVRAITMLG